MKLQKLFFAAVIVLSANASFAQDTNTDFHTVTINIPEVALLDLESSTGTAITLAGTIPTVAGLAEAGLPLDFSTAIDATIWMNYSSIIRGASLRNVGVELTTGAVPTGLKLTVVAGDCTSGAGTRGIASGAITLLPNTPLDIITGIGSAYTEDGPDNGRQLTYQLALSDTAEYSSLDADLSASLTITYTLTDI